MNSSRKSYEELLREIESVRAENNELHARLTDNQLSSNFVGAQTLTVDTQSALREHLGELETIYQEAPLGLCVLDLDSRYRRVNQKLAEMNGLPIEAHLGRTVREVVPGIADQADEIIREILETGKAKRFELRGQTLAQPGVDRIWDEDWYPLRNGQEITGIGIIVAETTEQNRALNALRQSEETFRVMFNHSSVGKAMIDIKTRQFLQVNPALCAMTGYSKTELLSFTVDQLTHPHDRECDMEMFRRFLRREFPDFRIEKRYLRKDGGIVWVHVTANLVRDPEGKPIHSISVIQDITDRKRMELELREADRKKDDFIAFLSHELRNPLAPIRNAVELLRITPTAEPNVVISRDIIDRQLTQISRLLDDLLDISRISRDKLQIVMEAVELQPIVNMAVETSRPLIQEWGHELIVETGPKPITVNVDSARLSQVLSNVLNNAAKYSEPGGKITLKTELRSEESKAGGNGVQVAVITIRDTGIGIPRDQLTNIFDPFVQVERNLEKSKGGLGIGLALAKRLIEMQGGRIDAFSEGANKGSDFTIILPAISPTTMLANESRDVVSSGALRIMVVDDMRLNTDSLAMLLEALGHETSKAYSGKEALEQFEFFQPEVVFMDLGMPGMDGYETARRMRDQFKEQKFTLIALTGWGQENVQQRALDAGFDAHLTKPVNLDKLNCIFAQVKTGDYSLANFQSSDTDSLNSVAP